MPPAPTPPGDPAERDPAATAGAEAGVLDAFDAAVTAAGADGLAAPELLPERLAVACAEVLSTDGAGLSLTFATGRRLPIGASDATAATAERLQFTVGEGPCLFAQDTSRPVLAGQAELQGRWPVFHDELLRRTPFRGVVSLPLPDGMAGIGALDLYFTRDADVPRLSLFTSTAVSTAIARHLHTAMARATTSDDGAPAWLESPAARSRALVWQALGYLNTTLHVTTRDALALLRAHAYGLGQDVDTLAEQVLSGTVPAADLYPGDTAPPHPDDRPS